MFGKKSLSDILAAFEKTKAEKIADKIQELLAGE